MKNPQFYIKTKINNPSSVNSVFSKRSRWRIVWITILAVLVGPLIIYKRQRSLPFTLGSYLQFLQYFSIIAVPFVAFLLWINWRESVKRNSGYIWVGKFEVIGKRSSFLSYYLLVAPGIANQIKVDRNLFEKTRVGDFVQVRKDVLGSIEEIRKVKDFPSRLARGRGRFIPKPL